MANVAELRGFEEVLRAMEARLGPAKVNEVVNKSLGEMRKEVEPEFKEAIAVFSPGGRYSFGHSEDEVVVSGVRRDEGIPMIKVGFANAKMQRWRLVHLQEWGFNRWGRHYSPAGTGAIRKFVERQRESFPEKVRLKVKEGFGV